MPPINNNYQVNVNVNFNGVSYNASTGTWTGQPSWTVNPQLQPVPPVKAGVATNTITWVLHAASVPNPFTAAFANAGIGFASNWTGGQPGNLNSTNCVVSDNFNGLANNEVFEYVITVNLSGTVNGGTVSQNFLCDPDVENESGTVNVAALVRTRK
jgi:hypothetical protein